MPPMLPRLTTTSLTASVRCVSPFLVDHLGFEQRAALLEIASGEDRDHGVLHARERDVGEEAQSSQIDADERHVVRRELARHGEERAVAADDDRDIGLCAQALGRGRGIAREGRELRGLGFEHDLVPASLEEAREPCQRFCGRRGRIPADQGDAAQRLRIIGIGHARD